MDIHIGINAWRTESLEKSFASVADTFPDSRVFLLVREREEVQLRRICKGRRNTYLLTPARIRSILSLSSNNEFSIGAARNILQLISTIFEPAAHLILLDDDVSVDEHTRKAFESAFRSYDLVQGQYRGSGSNNFYLMVYFFQLLLKKERTESWQEKIHQALCGVFSFESPASPLKLQGAVGGLIGISSKLKCKQAFAPTKHPFEDHFFEFSSRYRFRNLRMMDYQTPSSAIPVAEHKSIPASVNKLVDDYIMSIRAAIIENYFYYKLCGAIPKIVQGHHVLQRIQNFNLVENSQRAIHESAMEKFRQMAQLYRSQFDESDLREQLDRIIALESADVEISEDELQKEWNAYIWQQQWLERTYQQCLQENRRNTICKLIEDERI